MYICSSFKASLVNIHCTYSVNYVLLAAAIVIAIVIVVVIDCDSDYDREHTLLNTYYPVKINPKGAHSK
jgi:hypothetical protein